jgi:hypothetical protein
MAKMTKKQLQQIEELLQKHSQALVVDDEPAVRAVEQIGAQERTLTQLFDLSHELKTTLKPINPSRQYVGDLRARLAESRAAALVKRARRSANFRKTVRTTLIVLAVAAVATQIVSSIIMVIMYLRSRRQATA